MGSLDALVPSTSNYLAKEDVGEAGQNLTIAGFDRTTVGQGADADERAIMSFQEDVKPMVLNKTNKNRLKHFLGTDDTDEIIGRVVNVYNDPTVEYGGEMTGGIRIRAATAPQPAPDAASKSDDIPW